MNLIPSLYPPYTLLIPCLIPSEIEVEPGLLYPYAQDGGMYAGQGFSLSSLLEGIRGYKGIRTSVECALFPYTLLIPSPPSGYKTSQRRAPQCAICGGSGLDLTKPLPWGGYEACTHCLIPDGWSPEAHPGWRRHLPTGYAHRSPPAAPRRAPAAKVRPHHPQPQNARGEAPTASGAHRSHP